MKPITHISLHRSLTDGDGDFLVGLRVVFDRKSGNTVYGRTLRPNEVDSGEGIPVKSGENLEFPPRSIGITMADVDRYAEIQSDGYAPVGNTVWTWLALPPDQSNHSYVVYLLAAARRLDSAYKHFRSASHLVSNLPPEKGYRARETMFDALGDAESMCIALNRAIRMINAAQQSIQVSTAVPREIEEIKETVESIRNAIEHIDERALGRARRENYADAISVFDQSDFFTSGVLKYAESELDIDADVLPALIKGREFIIDAAQEAGLCKICEESIKFQFTDEEPTSSHAIDPK